MNLQIDGKDYKIKFSWAFYQYCVESYTDDKDADGFNVFVNDLLNQNPDALVKGYRLAITDKKKPSLDAVAGALAEGGVFDSQNPYADLYGQLKQDGFLTLKLTSLAKRLKQEADNTALAFKIYKQNGEKKDNLRQMQIDVDTAKAAYELAAKKMDQFDELLAKKH